MIVKIYEMTVRIPTKRISISRSDHNSRWINIVVTWQVILYSYKIDTCFV